MPKKLLSTILKERTESIEYRDIRSQLMTLAQNNKSELFRIRIGQYALDRLRNEGLTIELISDFGTDKYRVSW